MSEHIQEIQEKDFEAQVLGAAGPVVLDFYSTECPPCEALASKFESLSLIYGDAIRFLKIYRQGNRALAEKLNVRSSPTLLFFKNGKEVAERLSGGVKRAATEAALDSLLEPGQGRKLRESRSKVAETACDVLILGGGPAGLTAGIYCAQAKLRTLVVDQALGGGNVATTHQVSNFPGFPKPQPGYLLAHYMVEHAKEAGVELRAAVDLTSVDLSTRTVVLDGVERITARKVIVATGSSPRVVGIKGEIEYKGKGVSYCATCDGKYFENKHAVVIGGGNSAIEEALFIAKFASKITIVHQLDKLQANKLAQEAAFANPKISFLLEHEPREFVAVNGAVTQVIVENLKTKERRAVDCDGVFVFAGMRPNLDVFNDVFKLDQFGYLQVDSEMRTNLPHVFAAGDVATKRYRQITTAVSEGTVAAISVTKELEAEAMEAARKKERAPEPAHA